MDSTDRPNYQDELASTLSRLSLIVDAARLGTWDWNIETGELWWSRACLEMFGLSPDTRMSYDKFLDAIHPEDRDRVDQAVQACLRSPQEYSTEMRSIWPDGSIHWIASRGRTYFNEAGQPVRMSGAGMDVTGLKDNEEDLLRARAEAKAQAENLSAVLDAVPAAVLFSHDRSCENMITNRAGYELLRMPVGSNTSRSAPEGERPPFTIWENGRELKAEELPVQQAAATGQPVRNKELEIRFEDGSCVFVFGHGIPLFGENGEVRGAVGAFLDITDRKNLLERLRTTTERFQIALRNSPVTVFNQGLDLRYKWMYNPSAGFNVAEIIGQRDEDFLENPADVARLRALKSEVMSTGRSFKGEVVVQHQGVPRTYHITMEPQRDENARIIGLTCASFDLTERKAWEAEREKLARQRQLALDAARMGSWHYDAAKKISHWDDTFKQIFGVAVNSGPPELIVALVHPDDADRVWQSFLGAMNLANPKPYHSEYRILRPDGIERWVEAHGAAEFQGEGASRHAVSCSGTVRDITERKAAEEALSQQRERAEFVAQTTGVGFWFCDLPFDKLIWDQRVKEHFWLPPDAEVTIDLFYKQIHPDDREPTRKAIDHSIATRTRYEIEYRTVAPDGRFKWIRAIGRTFYDKDGRPARFDGITLDITENKLAHEKSRNLAETLELEVQSRTSELEKRNQEVLRVSDGLRDLSSRLLRIQDEERRRIARDLHDSAGQLLTAVDLELTDLVTQVRALDPDLARRAENTEKLVQQLYRELRTTSYLLHPPLLDEAGLSSALRWYVGGLSERSGIDVQLEIAPSFPRLARETELAIFRMVQECLTNIHRHSGSATAIIRLRQEPGRVCVEVQDHGKGISPERLSSIQAGGSGVGLRGMRERIRQMRGELNIESGNTGTRVIAAIPFTEGTPEQEGRAEPQTTAI